MRYVLSTTPNVCSYTTLAKMNCQISTCSTTDSGFISTKLFFVFKSNFDSFAEEIHQKKMSTIHVAVSHHTEFLYLITNQAPDAIKAIVHTVNMKFRKLKKNNVRNTNKSRQLKQEVLELSSMGVGIENKRSFVEIKPVKKGKGAYSSS